MSKALEIAECLDAVPENGADPDLIQSAAAELRRLDAENEALKADAERYRWLRLPGSGVPISDEAARDSVFYDAAVDHAMKKENHHG